MSFSKRAGTIAEIAQRVLAGGKAGMEVKCFLHEFKWRGAYEMLAELPARLAGLVEKGEMLDAYLQPLAVYLAIRRLKCDPPEWTREMVVLREPWFVSPGSAIRNYLLLSTGGIPKSEPVHR